MSRKQKIAAIIAAAALAGLLYGLPAIESTIAAIAWAALCLVILAAAVFGGGLTEIEEMPRGERRAKKKT